MLISRIELLAKLPVFRGLSEKQLSSIVDVGTKAFFESGDKLIAKDEAGHASYLIMTGSAICVDFPTAGRVGAVIAAGSLVGELAMLVNTVHPFTVQASGKVRAMAIHRHGLTRAMEQDPSIAQQISDNLLIRLKALAQDLRRFDGILEEVGTVSKFHLSQDGKQHYTSVTVALSSQKSTTNLGAPIVNINHPGYFRDRLLGSDTKEKPVIPDAHQYIRHAKTRLRELTSKSSG